MGCVITPISWVPLGPGPEAETQAGGDMASYFWDIGARQFLILSGGASMNNYMHYARVQGMLEALAKAGGFSYTEPVETLAGTESTVVIQMGEVEITVAPGYFSQESGQANVKEAIASGEYDALLCAYNVDTVLPYIVAREDELGHSIRTARWTASPGRTSTSSRPGMLLVMFQSTTLRENTPPWPVRRLRRCTMP